MEKNRTRNSTTDPTLRSGFSQKEKSFFDQRVRFCFRSIHRPLKRSKIFRCLKKRWTVNKRIFCRFSIFFSSFRTRESRICQSNRYSTRSHMCRSSRSRYSRSSDDGLRKNFGVSNSSKKTFGLVLIVRLFSGSRMSLSFSLDDERRSRNSDYFSNS